ncbi:MAG: 16S rRNA (uracil(1498)-N(3))-methyltransferase [Pseudomonadales bacterium]|jgi:16S rRNA (uracil1498-N3)-methyltransferase|nr:16S rRNA (uracil(1498)-N(3))-methyltransferase [Pseudomonadales bacterium]
MRVPRLLLDGPLAAGERELESEAAHYLVSVLRRRPGDALRVFDGAGTSADARVLLAERRRCVISLDPPFAEQVESPLAVHLGIALSRGERMDVALQKACELGVHAITPLFTERTEVRLEGKRLDNRMRHWGEVLRHATQQSGRTVLPALHAPLSLDAHLRARGEVPGFVMDPSGRPLAALAPGASARAHLLTGPEGGFSEGELSAADALGWLRLATGPRVLRAETAPIVGLALLQAVWGDLDGT